MIACAQGLVFQLSLVLVLTVHCTHAQAGSDSVGQVMDYQVQADETLLDIARRYGLGFHEIVTANQGVDPWLPGVGTVIKLPTEFLFPAAPRQGIVVNLAEYRLYLFGDKGKLVLTVPIGIGQRGLTTPLGSTQIIRKRVNPTWTPTPEARKRDPNLPISIPPGPDNPLGTHALDLGWPAYAIHGTHRPWGVGRSVSSGCIRLYPEDIKRLFEEVQVGAVATIVDQPVKLGWANGNLFLEVHPNQEQADQLEELGRFEQNKSDNDLEAIRSLAGEDASRIDWSIVERALIERTGYPVPITPVRPSEL